MCWQQLHTGLLLSEGWVSVHFVVIGKYGLRSYQIGSVRECFTVLGFLYQYYELS